MAFDRSRFCIPPETPLRDAVGAIDRNQRGIVLVVDGEEHLIDTITDGDVRRAMLMGVDLAVPVSDLLARRAQSPYAAPVTAPEGTPRERLLAMMRETGVRQVPLVDAAGRIVDLAALEDLLPPTALPLEAVVMAGGHGRRLRPLTENTPKPMLPVGGRPIIERIVGQLQQAGIRRVSIATHYRGDRIVDHFGDGAAYGVDLTYVNEEEPLGTAGALGLLPAPTSTVLVINGDILTELDFRAMLEFHQDQRAEITVALRRYDVDVPYGVIDCEGVRVRGIREKPRTTFFVNAGIYLLEPSAYDAIVSGARLDMTDLIDTLIRQERTVIGFPVREYWLDIGQPSDYQRAQDEVMHLDRDL